MLSLIAIPILYFTMRSLTIYSFITLVLGLTLFTLGAFIQLTIETALKDSQSKSIEDLEVYASSLAKGWVEEFESRYG